MKSRTRSLIWFRYYPIAQAYFGSSQKLLFGFSMSVHFSKCNALWKELHLIQQSDVGKTNRITQSTTANSLTKIITDHCIAMSRMATQLALASYYYDSDF